MRRRRFIQQVSTGGMLVVTGSMPFDALAAPELHHLTILHTNDVHSRIDPFPMDGSRMQGLGGAARRAALIDKVRAEREHVLLFDSGDIFQGTPYFNMFKGEPEIKLMSAMRYDAATIGNHDFDGGIDNLAVQLGHATFPMVISNYDFSDTIMHTRTLPYRVIQKGKLRVGVLGVGIKLEGLVPEALYDKTRYLDPVSRANHYAAILKNDERCDIVICLSHLGHQYRDSTVSDMVLAEHSYDIDIILGGHTHTFLDAPVMVKNRRCRPVVINQTGWAGVRLGRIDVTFERNRKKVCVSCDNIWLR